MINPVGLVFFALLGSAAISKIVPEKPLPSFRPKKVRAGHGRGGGDCRA